MNHCPKLKVLRLLDLLTGLVTHHKKTLVSVDDAHEYVHVGALAVLVLGDNQNVHVTIGTLKTIDNAQIKQDSKCFIVPQEGREELKPLRISGVQQRIKKKPNLASSYLRRLLLMD